eukprot:TRINITY_DN8954_c0_g1_i1.p1 TRINITY_DN8954_c0_g1~~TRINITY_DN8954_c0_g1_i1.p1  ORF type:complete len:693 (+),score=154.17 TRINITY_DN8954_c0_g1_i1:280-2079(+)
MPGINIIAPSSVGQMSTRTQQMTITSPASELNDPASVPASVPAATTPASTAVAVTPSEGPAAEPTEVTEDTQTEGQPADAPQMPLSEPEVLPPPSEAAESTVTADNPGASEPTAVTPEAAAPEVPRSSDLGRFATEDGYAKQPGTPVEEPVAPSSVTPLPEPGVVHDSATQSTAGLSNPASVTTSAKFTRVETLKSEAMTISPQASAAASGMVASGTGFSGVAGSGVWEVPQASAAASGVWEEVAEGTESPWPPTHHDPAPCANAEAALPEPKVELRPAAPVTPVSPAVSRGHAFTPTGMPDAEAYYAAMAAFDNEQALARAHSYRASPARNAGRGSPARKGKPAPKKGLEQGSSDILETVRQTACVLWDTKLQEMHESASARRQRALEQRAQKSNPMAGLRDEVRQLNLSERAEQASARERYPKQRFDSTIKAQVVHDSREYHSLNTTESFERYRKAYGLPPMSSDRVVKAEEERAAGIASSPASFSPQRASHRASPQRSSPRGGVAQSIEAVKTRHEAARLQPAAENSIDAVARLRKLKKLSAATPLFSATPAKHLPQYLNPHHPEWRVQDDGKMFLPDGSAVNLFDAVGRMRMAAG